MRSSFNHMTSILRPMTIRIKRLKDKKPEKPIAYIREFISL